MVTSGKLTAMNFYLSKNTNIEFNPVENLLNNVSEQGSHVLVVEGTLGTALFRYHYPGRLT